jgi:hypothetical protein
MAAPAVEAAPIGALLGASLLAICAYLTLVGLSKAYDYTLGALLHKLGQVLDFRVWKFKVPVGGAFDALDHSIRDSIGAGITQLEATIGRLFHGMEYLVKLQWDTLAGFAHDVEDAIVGLYSGAMPQIVKHTTQQIVKPVREHTTVTVKRVTHLEHTVYRGIDELRRDLTRAWQTALRGIDDLRGALAHDVIPAIRGLEGEVAALGRLSRGALNVRLRRLEHLVLGGAIVGAALATLTRYFPYWQCTNVRAFNRVLCRSPIGAPEELLGFLLAAGAIANLRTLVRVAQGVTGETAGGIHALLRVTR